MKDFMHDTVFLRALDNDHNKIIYAKVISLTRDEQPIEAIEGVVQSGSITIDGASAVRRSCNLTMTTKNVDINEVYWGFQTRVKIEIGLQNHVDTQYPDIIWFKQGVYVLTDFKTSSQVNNYTITLQAKDKMCLLNGDISGHFNAETNLGEEDTVEIIGVSTNNGITVKKPIKYIIRKMIHDYGQEPWANIIINNVEDYGLNMLDNISNNTYYLWRNSDTGEYEYITNDDGQNPLGGPQISTDNIKDNKNFIFLNGIEEDANNLNGKIAATSVDRQLDGEIKRYQIFQIEPQGPAGYQQTDLVYDKELIAGIGDTITSILDKLVKFLGPFEYFYNLDGQFVFQAKDTYLNTQWAAAETLDTVHSLSYVNPYLIANKISYEFENSILNTAVQNNPNLLNIRNDYTIWGKKRSHNGTEPLIHARYALDKKPLFYKTLDTLDDQGQVEKEGILYITKECTKLLEEPEAKIVDWRELIYQMALDYYPHQYEDDFETRVAKQNRDISSRLQILDYYLGKTGYEQYYQDIQGFWRKLYNPDTIDAQEPVETVFPDGTSVTYGPDGWNLLVTEDPTQLDFWFDFYDINTSSMGKFSVPAIGMRTKVVNDDDVRVIVYKDTPDVIYMSPGEAEMGYDLSSHGTGYSHLIVPTPENEEMENFITDHFSIARRSKSAKETMDDLVYNYSHTNDNITLTTVPIYYLQPNKIIHVHDIQSNIDGYYEIKKITLPLAYNGTMSINAVKIPQQIY